ncbi:MAG: YicC/YloC family endoribonuclease [Saprospiraceae bacterium]
MILSMTGYGQAKKEIDGKIISVEIKSLNARSTEMRCKLPVNFSDREMELRKRVLDSLQRGKIDITISIDGFSDEDSLFVNAAAFKKYYREVKSIVDDLGIQEGDIIQAIMRIPSVLSLDPMSADESEWHDVESVVDDALVKINEFRIQEGKVLEVDMKERVNHIEKYLKGVGKFEAGRLEKIKERLRKNMSDFAQNQQVDQNRYEQEILYYLEKLDINEEKVRLAQHCNYFFEELKTDEVQKGRKLSFIAQEIGREINTIGAKAQDSDIQQLVVMMKDELEKLKEQLANIM